MEGRHWAVGPSPRKGKVVGGPPLGGRALDQRVVGHWLLGGPPLGGRALRKTVGGPPLGGRALRGWGEEEWRERYSAFT